ncbi:ATP-dependent DNA helicase [Pandoraea nosoerga]|nr:ATP-dependent DNA helicase [Pandoraea nosoerga]MBN4665824.1 ATP-dependent DNA helicase [Pandoraea nosoerga]MBN4677277.1 ATP-dependent DNA helicase [Pandoraea nosoerga]MBN4681138.1 ATP-dependent DNA helicase [Pandoraea nosoerga]MBN4746369.1 ATP-dependent DNA helicase [Pandoraea nosoerga]
MDSAAAASDSPETGSPSDAATFHGLKPLAPKRERELQAIFGDGGMLARAIDGYRSREPQTEMARAVAAAMDTHDTLIAEAGTGTGKTYAYLVPAMLWGGKTIISTGTKHLQDQIFARDIPTVRRALAVPVTVAMLKGRANYLCHYYLERAQQEGRFASRHEAAQLREITTFAQITRSGDKAELASVPENAPIWSQVTSTRENCLGQDCPRYKDCFVMLARKEAQQADIVVVNHHLFFADVMLRDTGMAELLPSANTVIFDEAHQLPETATLFFGETVSSAQMLELARDCVAEGLIHARDAADWVKLGANLERAARDVRLTFGPDNARMSVTQLPENHELFDALEAVDAALQDMIGTLTHQAERAEALGACLRRALDLRQQVGRWQTGESPPLPGEPPLPLLDPDAPRVTDSKRERAAKAAKAAEAREAEAARAAVEAASRGSDRGSDGGDGGDGGDGAGSGQKAYTPPENVRWIEVFSQTVQLHQTPLSIAPIFAKQRAGAPRAWIFTSATLSVKGNFTHYAAQLGLDAQKSLTLASPFDYQNQSLLYVPRGLPQPSAPGFTDAVLDAALPVLEVSGGRAFVLCTTLRAVGRAAERLRDEFERRGWDYPLLVQGEASRTELLDRFRALGNAVLVGSQSFWEGVDVRGEALSLVIIDKLPFAPPDDPVLAARLDALTKKGLSPFAVHQLPQAVITLKQGAGRLIRSERDRGVLMICDPRLVDKPYGRRIWQSLPPFKRTRELPIVRGFFDEMAAGGDAGRS